MPVAYLERSASSYLERSTSETARLPSSELLLIIDAAYIEDAKKEEYLRCLKPICIGKPGRRFRAAASAEE